MSSAELFLHEELMLLALRDREGTIAAESTYVYAVGGAALAEPMMSERVSVEKERKKAFVVAVDDRPVGNEVLDEWLATIGASKKRRTLQHWIARIARTKKLKHRVATGLCRRGILRTAEDKVRDLLAHGTGSPREISWLRPPGRRSPPCRPR